MPGGGFSVRLFYSVLLLVFAFTLFLSATLLFLVQPMVGKMILPLLGGSPSVWNTCMVFFQALLLAGYTYAHVTTSWLGVRRQAVVHLGTLLLPLLVLPIAVNKELAPQGQDNPIFGVFGLLLVSAGLPFFVVATSAPLLQKWFASTGHPSAQDPYFLYGASNLGSMLALMSYPLVIEPTKRLADQAWLWGLAYGVLAALTTVCAVLLWLSPRREGGARALVAPAPLGSQDRATSPSPLVERPTLATRLHWIALAFVPSSLMFGVTTHITTDLAAIPLLWVLPLSLYLLSFILVFSRLPPIFHHAMRLAFPMALVVLVFIQISELTIHLHTTSILANLGVLFLAAMVCHGELARKRPTTEYLTSYYLFMSLGGVLGGLFNSLAAPLVFNTVMEYPVALILACLLMPYIGPRRRTLFGRTIDLTLLSVILFVTLSYLSLVLRYHRLNLWLLLEPSRLRATVTVLVGLAAVLAYAVAGKRDWLDRWLDVLLPLALLVLAVGSIWGLWYKVYNDPGLSRWLPHNATAEAVVICLLVFGIPAGLCLMFLNRPVQFGLGLGALLLAGGMHDSLVRDTLHKERGFFGVLAVVNDTAEGQHFLLHGNINHGVQQYELPPAMMAELLAPLVVCPPTDFAWNAAVRLQLWQARRAELRQQPIAYFHPDAPIGQLFQSLQGRWARRNIAILGLGTGGLSAYAQRGQKLTYFEIDPAVPRIAWDSRYFTYLQDCQARGVDLKIILGDGRLQMEKVQFERPEDRYDLIIFDAFTSDAIPIHLVTYDALQLYLSKLTPNGIVVFHISNSFVDLMPVLGRLKEEAGLVGFVQDGEGDFETNLYPTVWVVMARSREAFGPLAADERWRRQKLESRPDVGLWTDDFSNLFGVFRWKDEP
jgi:spermidine synthase